MMNNEGMGRRACKDGDEQDYLTSARRYYHCHHGVVGKVKAIRNKRVRRQVRQALRSGSMDEG